MTSVLSDSDWTSLLERIKAGRCTPFLGAGACYDVLPLGSDIARILAEEYDYPLSDTFELPRVTQYLAVKLGDPMRPKEIVMDRWFKDLNLRLPNFDDPDEPHSFLASLPLPVYITTNYDPFMIEALRKHHKEPKRVVCAWNSALRNSGRTRVRKKRLKPTVPNPWVYHLHGSDNQYESLVLTEDDYLDFLVNISQDTEVVPLYIRRSLATSSLIFLGYRLGDWDFRVLYRGLLRLTDPTLRRFSVTVQLLPDVMETKRSEAQNYLEKYFDSPEMRIKVYWGTAREFIEELRRRWELHVNG